MGARRRAVRWQGLIGAMALAVALLPAARAAAQEDAAQALRFFRIGTGASGGSYFPIGGLIASAISSPPGSRPCDKGGSCGVPGLIAVAQGTQGSVENLELIRKGELESGLCQADIAAAAFRGTGRFARVPVSGLRAIASLYREVVHVVVRADSSMRSIADLKGKRVAVGEEGSGSLADTEAILAAYRVRPRDIRFQFLQPGQASDALREGRIDAFFLIAGVPALTLTELAETVPIRLLPISGSAAAKLAEADGFFGRTEIPAGAYKGTEAAETLSLAAEWVTTVEVDAELVYGITKALWDKSTRKLLETGPPEAAQIRLETALDGLAVPLHPGAERYYREIGLLKGAAPGATATQ